MDCKKFDLLNYYFICGWNFEGVKMIAGLYYRVSTYDKQDVGMQKKAVIDYCDREGIKIYKEYSDVGQSGKKESRPEFDNLLKDMRAKLFDCVVCYKLDRIGRSLKHLVMLFEEFNKKKIKFVSVTQSFNTTTPEGKLMFRMLMILAEYERELIVSRINDGLSEAKAKGKKLGRPSGKKDGKRRRRSGYILRYMKQRQSKDEAKGIHRDIREYEK